MNILTNIRYIAASLLITTLCIFATNAISQERPTKFLLIMGPSGAGKSKIINHLKSMNSKFRYITPLTTRPLRPGERDKISIDLKELKSKEKNGELLTVNEIYGIFYGTPKYLIDQALNHELYPVLDWPIDKLAIMEKAYSKRLFRVYIYPENKDELRSRLKTDDRDSNGKRFQAGIIELEKLNNGQYDKQIDFKIANIKGKAEDTAKAIYEAYLNSL